MRDAARSNERRAVVKQRQRAATRPRSAMSGSHGTAMAYRDCSVRCNTLPMRCAVLSSRMACANPGVSGDDDRRHRAARWRMEPIRLALRRAEAVPLALLFLQGLTDCAPVLRGRHVVRPQGPDAHRAGANRRLFSALKG
eukprot:1253781-Rhodomonas_salina.1